MTFTPAQSSAMRRLQENPPSWIIRNKETGEILFETFNQKIVAALNKVKYEAIGIYDYLTTLNAAIAKGLDVTEAFK